MAYSFQTFVDGQVLTAAQMNQIEENIIQYGKFKSLAFTRDTSAASGNQAITGAGFTPKAALLLSLVTTTAKMSVGFTDGTNSYGFYDNQNNSAATWGVLNGGTIFVYLDAGGGATYSASLASFDSDGLTLTWTKAGSPTGTAQGLLLVMR